MNCKVSVRYGEFRNADLTELNALETLIVLEALIGFANCEEKNAKDRARAQEMFKLIEKKIREKEVL